MSKNDNIKSKAKALGLKSTFQIGDEVVMTSFGKGNKAIVEKIVRGTDVQSVPTEPNFSAEIEGKKFDLVGRARIQTKSDNPQYSRKRTGDDMIGAKAALEKRFFGGTFDDNIHIQLAYNVLDIEKILSVHINNIVYMLNNIRRKDSAEYDDFIGYMSTVNDYETFMEPRKHNLDENKAKNVDKSRASFEEYLQAPIKDSLHYFGNTFFAPREIEKTYTDNRGFERKKKVTVNALIDEKDIYYIFALLGGLRQFCMHDKKSVRNWLYLLDENGINADAKAVLDMYYNSAVAKIDESFVDNASKTNFKLIFNAMDVSDEALQDNIAKAFYKFTVCKSFKNMGFSIKKLREQLLELPEYEGLKDKRYDSVRSKLYQIMDFVVYLSFKDEKFKKDNEEKINNIVNELRATLNEEDKGRVYASYAERMKSELKPAIARLKSDIDKIKDNKVKEFELDASVKYRLSKVVESVRLKDKATYFTKLIYLTTLFLDDKEINDLLTTLIHQFENIASFIDVMNDRGIDCSFSDEYKLFDSSKQIAFELRNVNSFARMTKTSKDDDNAKQMMFIDAAEILGTDYTEEQIKEHLNLVDKDKRRMIPGTKKADMNFRNFIINNVIKSSRFNYLVRYSNPKKVRALADNEGVIRFVLGELPDMQIDRYTELCGFNLETDRSEKTDKLAKAITGLRFNDFENVKQGANAEGESQESIDKAQKQGLISLYLTVLYLLTKNLVYVNSRYFLAFHCLERDSQLLKSGAGYSEPYTALTQRFVDEGKLNEHACEYLKANIANADEYTINLFRNNVAHIAAVRNADIYIDGLKTFKSYYEIYHYLIQCSIYSRYQHDGKEGYVKNKSVTVRQGNGDIINASLDKSLEFFDKLNKYGTYCKDFTKALNSPFGYNLARYKNLSIEGLFDRNRPGEKGKNTFED